MKFQLTAVGLACATLLAACGGGGGDKGADGGLAQSIAFPFPGGATVGAPSTVATIELKATASSGGPVTYVSNTPGTCSVSGATLSLLKAGECSVNANQAGGDGFAPASARQLFVIPKRPVLIIFRNPGVQPLDAAPLPLVASAAEALPVTFSTSTPDVCSVSGSTLQKRANGLCVVSATAGGDDIYLTAKVDKTIPIGDAVLPPLNFASGYKANDVGRTTENGKIEWYSSDPTKTTVAADGSTFALAMDKQSDAPNFGGYYGLTVYAAGLQELVKGGETGGAVIDGQQAMKFNLMMNPEMVAANKTRLRVWLYLGHNVKFNNNDCNVRLERFITPVFSASAQGVQQQTIDLKSFTVVESCGLGALDVAEELQDHAISKIEFNVPDINNQVPNAGTSIYSTSVTMGSITFQ
ncbi:hypothetical protein NHH82_18615 [Oxalobacteraceae bacterium OTU3REALA1]|nr:hypothetical protein NHH82_18615 [Oxalobacteraceae bacterium OTU3REALA1]